ncbi:hypothetical protein [Alteraurantiacibacter aquimixticola]|uniref:DUF8021 domain-containing protein n=1 Tax=Alteraurantiacibacter aquimixticola TaxID=2489173 RepID=A0A4T3EYG7_9SPHN|nr:hypothetical protein [Alteraurantiacibacter aquimixticola]TIX49571.1 hypothetical protein E5222_12075 [Alteraurantiacibacter aquimixticola]
MATALVAATLASQQASAQIGAECDRECLIGMMDAYFDALETHDSGRLTLSNDIKYTENGVTLALTDGLWNTVQAQPSYRFDVADPVNGEVAALAIINENGNQNNMSIRLRVENRRITEIENLVVRNITSGGSAGAFVTVERTEVLPIFNRIEPEDTRVPRHKLQEAADRYFRGIESEVTAGATPFHPDCQRMENNSWTANSPDGGSNEMAKLDCAAQFDTGFQTIVTNIRARRFPVIDEERQLVYALGFFDHAGTVPAYAEPSGEAQAASGAFAQPFSFIIAEVFKLEDGKLRQIEAVLTTVPYGMPSGW